MTNADLPVLDRLEEALLNGCYGGPSGVPARRTGLMRRMRPVRHPLRAASAAAVVAAAVGAALIVSLASESVSPSAAGVLARAAAASEMQPAAPLLGPGQYWYTRSISLSRVPFDHSYGQRSLPFTVLYGQSDEIWVGRTGTERQRTVTLSERYASPDDAAAAHSKRDGVKGLPPFAQQDSIQEGDGRFPAESSIPFDPGDGWFTYAQLQSLPTSPRALGAAIERASVAFGDRQAAAFRATTLPSGARIPLPRVGPSAGKRPSAEVSAVQTAQNATELLSSPIPGRVAAAIYRLIATLPGVQFDGSARDSLGRRGVVVSIGQGDARFRMLFDPRTGTLLAEGYPGFGSGFATTIVATGVVNSIRALPAGIRPTRGPRWLRPTVVTITPGHGTPHTVFRLAQVVTKPAASGRLVPGVEVIGPTGPHCSAPYMQPNPQLGHGRVVARHGASELVFRLGPRAVGDRRWCEGRYLVEFTPFSGSADHNHSEQTAGVFFTISSR